MKYRNSQQITEAVLTATQDAGMEGIKVTRLMVKSNLSHQRLGGFISKLVSSGLLNSIEYDGRNTYIITEKGRMFLQEYQKFSDLAGSFGLEL